MNHIRVKYKPATYHKGGEPVCVRRCTRNLGREFRAYVSDDLGALWMYAQNRINFGEVVL